MNLKRVLSVTQKIGSMPRKNELYTLTRKKEELKIATHDASSLSPVVKAYPLKIHSFPGIAFFVNRITWEYHGPLKQKPWLVSERLTGKSLGTSCSTIAQAVTSAINCHGREFNEEHLSNCVKRTPHINDPLP